jgi:hypothetical protein
VVTRRLVQLGAEGESLMSGPFTFNEDDWRELTMQDKNALRKFSKVSFDFEPLSRAPGVGEQSMDALIAKGLAVEGQSSIYGRTFKLTNKGWLAVEWLSGRKTRVG